MLNEHEHFQEAIRSGNETCSEPRRRMADSYSLDGKSNPTHQPHPPSVDHNEPSGDKQESCHTRTSSR